MIRSLRGFVYLSLIAKGGAHVDIGSLIKAYRTKNNLTQAAFGKIVGVNKQTISKWENGVQPSTEKLFEITQAINVPVSSILKDDIQDEEDRPFIYAHKTKYDVGLNSVYRYVYDFMSLCKFIDVFESAHQLLEPNSKIVGFLMLNTTVFSKNFHEKELPINSVYWDGTDIIIEITDCTLCFTKEDVSHVNCIASFNNELYAFNVYLAKEQDAFIQLVLGFHNNQLE